MAKDTVLKVYEAEKAADTAENDARVRAEDIIEAAKAQAKADKEEAIQKANEDCKAQLENAKKKGEELGKSIEAGIFEEIKNIEETAKERKETAIKVILDAII